MDDESYMLIIEGAKKSQLAEELEAERDSLRRSIPGRPTVVRFPDQLEELVTVVEEILNR